MTREEWDRMLIEPLPGQPARPPSEAEIEADTNAFFDFMGQVG